jgi:hypothetical protein
VSLVQKYTVGYECRCRISCSINHVTHVTSQDTYLPCIFRKIPIRGQWGNTSGPIGKKVSLLSQTDQPIEGSLSTKVQPRVQREERVRAGLDATTIAAHTNQEHLLMIDDTAALVLLQMSRNVAKHEKCGTHSLCRSPSRYQTLFF